MSTQEPRILHVDMDSYYASCELLRYPDLRGQPVVIGGRGEHEPVTLADGTRRYARLRDYSGRGVITTSTYEARKLGVFSGMPTMQCAKLAPDAVLLPADFPTYRHYSRLFKAAVATVVPRIEDRGIDEIYADARDVPGQIRDVARAIKDAVIAATGLTCSVGCAPNKLIAKIASDLEKPDGLTVITQGDIATRIWPLPAAKINGIGPKAAQKLTGLGIHTIHDLAHADPSLLQANFGLSTSQWLLDAANGVDHREVVTHSEPKSFSRETTFENDRHPQRDRAELTPAFTALCERVAEDLRRKGYAGRTIGIKVRFSDFQTVTRDFSLPHPTDDAREIRRAAGECLRRVSLDKRIRLLGVRVTGVCRKADLPASAPVQGRLFDH